MYDNSHSQSKQIIFSVQNSWNFSVHNWCIIVYFLKLILQSLYVSKLPGLQFMQKLNYC